MGSEEIRDPNPSSSRWLIYVGVGLLALGVAVLVVASLISYSAALR